jgi:peptide/nickel transport system ATP-binding protein
MLKLENFCVDYAQTGTTVRVLDSIDFEVQISKKIAVLGLSGSGKTTLISALAGFGSKSATTSGKRLLSGDGSIHFVSQNSYESFHHMRSLGWHLEETLRFLPPHKRYPQNQQTELIESFLSGGSELLSRHPYEVSGGQLLRFNLAVGVLRKPDFLIADEPTSALDHKTAIEVAGLIRRAAEITGAALVIATHDLDVARATADDAVLLEAGRIVANGPIDLISQQYIDSWKIEPPQRTTIENNRSVVDLIDFRNVALGYKGRPKTIVKADLSISTDSRILIEGRSGAGKSTLLRSFYDSTIKLQGDHNFPISGKASKRRAAGPKLGLVFQDTWSTLNPRMTIGEILLEASRAGGIQCDKRRIREMLASAGLEPSMSARTPEQLSGGQRQRVSILRAIANNPLLLLLDEPTSQLDPVSTGLILHLIHKISQHNTGIVISSHKASEFDWFHTKRLELRDQKLQEIL